jgi:Tfp pilus assembly protein PilO
MKPAAQRLVGILSSLALFIGTLIVYSSLVLPVYREIQNLRGEKAAKAVVLQEQEDSVAAIESLLQKYNSISDLRQSINQTLPSEEEVAAVVNQIQGIASSNGVFLNSLSIKSLSAPTNKEETSLAGPVGSMRILVEMVGDYSALKNFLAAIETNIRIMDVYSVQVANGGTVGPYTYQIEIDTYYQS